MSIFSLSSRVSYNSTLMLKRGFDIIVSLLFVCIPFPFIFIIVGLAIKFTSKGPIIFCQQRSGKDGKLFTCYKFRSMVNNKTADTEQSTEGDRRVTRLGKFLRKSSIDELLQFVNVLLGDMSIVGPRPHMVYHTEVFSKVVPNYMERLSVRPGITGLAQIEGLRGATPTDEDMAHRVRLDLWYIRHMCLRLDLYIFWRTILHFWE